MTNIEIYCLIVVAFGFLFARYAAVGNAVRDWARILKGDRTVGEDVAKDVATGTDSGAANFYYRMGLANENPMIRNAIQPITQNTKIVFAMWGGLFFILSGFFWTRWYWPLVALPVFLFVLPKLFMPFLIGRRTGYKQHILAGLDIKIEAAKKFDTERDVALLQGIQEEIRNTEYRR